MGGVDYFSKCAYLHTLHTGVMAMSLESRQYPFAGLNGRFQADFINPLHCDCYFAFTYIFFSHTVYFGD